MVAMVQMVKPAVQRTFAVSSRRDDALNPMIDSSLHQ